MERLNNLTRTDPENREYAAIAYLNDNGRVLLPKQPIRGEQNLVQLEPPNGKRRLLVLHSHPTDTPFSPGDLSALFIPPKEVVSAPGLLLATPTVKMLILRTSATPVLSPQGILDVTAEMLNDYGVPEESDYYQRSYKVNEDEDIDRMQPFTEEAKQILRELSHKRMFALGRAAKEYHLAMYSCPVSENVAARAD